MPRRDGKTAADLCPEFSLLPAQSIEEEEEEEGAGEADDLEEEEQSGSGGDE